MLKTVTFGVPLCGPHQRASTAPAKRLKTHCLNSRKSATSNVNSTISSLDKAKPDLIADIVDRPKTATGRTAGAGDAPQNIIGTPAKGVAKAIVSPSNGNSASACDQVERSDGEKAKSSSIINPGNSCFQASTKNFGFDKNPVHHTGRQCSSKYKITSSSQVMHMARHCREQCNAATHIHMRTSRHDVAKLRLQLVKLEEEIKQMTRGRGLLVVGIQEMRLSLSVNQQSISTIQKRTKRGAEVGAAKAVVV